MEKEGKEGIVNKREKCVKVRGNGWRIKRRDGWWIEKCEKMSWKSREVKEKEEEGMRGRRKCREWVDSRMSKLVIKRVE